MSVRSQCRHTQRSLWRAVVLCLISRQQHTPMSSLSTISEFTIETCLRPAAACTHHDSRVKKHRHESRLPRVVHTTGTGHSAHRATEPGYKLAPWLITDGILHDRRLRIVPILGSLDFTSIQLFKPALFTQSDKHGLIHKWQ